MNLIEIFYIALAFYLIVGVIYVEIWKEWD